MMDYKRVIQDINHELALTVQGRVQISLREYEDPLMHALLRVLCAHIQGELDVRDLGLK